MSHATACPTLSPERQRMSTELVPTSQAGTLATGICGFTVPATIADQGDKAAERFFTFFTDTIPNQNTRAAYYRNAMRFFAWTGKKRLSLDAIKSYHVCTTLIPHSLCLRLLLRCRF